MSRKLTYNINRFDGGMSDDLRTSDLSKCAYVSHFDIYCDKNRLNSMEWNYYVDGPKRLNEIIMWNEINLLMMMNDGGKRIIIKKNNDLY